MLTIPKYRFVPASLASDYVFGSERPGYPSKVVSSLELNQWLSFMDDQGIERICCLLDEEQLGFYSDSPLLQTYEKKYGSANVLHALVPDFQLCPVDLLVDKILPFLKDSLSNRKKTVVHCSGGKGRTGHVLAAWLVHAENKSPDESIVTVSSLYREPLESIERGNASREDLDRLLVRAGL